MNNHFKVGDHVRWNPEVAQVSGVIKKAHKRYFTWKGYKRHCSEDDPQYEIKSDETDHIAVHKGSALNRMCS